MGLFCNSIFICHPLESQIYTHGDRLKRHKSSLMQNVSHPCQPGLISSTNWLFAKSCHNHRVFTVWQLGIFSGSCILPPHATFHNELCAASRFCSMILRFGLLVPQNWICLMARNLSSKEYFTNAPKQRDTIHPTLPLITSPCVMAATVTPAGQ